jgi:hypothetical protein
MGTLHFSTAVIDNHATLAQNVSSMGFRNAAATFNYTMNKFRRNRLRGSSSAIAAALWVAIALASRGDEPAAAKVAPMLKDVAAALEGVSSSSGGVSFVLGNTKVPRGGHLQGIQVRFDAVKKRHLVYLTHDSETVAYMLVVGFTPDVGQPGRIVTYQEFPSDGRSPPLRHAGGIQLVGDVLAVGLEDNQLKTRSEVQFWDVSNAEKPTQLTHLTVARSGAAKDKTSGAVGLLRREAGHVLAVANWDSRAIDFYLTTEANLADSACRFKHHGRWTVESATTTDWRPDSSFETYQAINLVADVEGTLYLLGLNTTVAGQDIDDLFAVRLDQPPDKMLRKLAHRELKLTRENHFRFGGGIWVDGDRLVILSSPRNLTPETWIGIAR